MRPEIKVESSAFRNALAMDLELSPISWIILGVGKTYEHRSDNGRYDYDCKVASCYGGLERSRFTFGGFPIAVGPLFIGGFMRREWIDSQDSGNRDFVEQISGLVGKTASDRLQSDAILAGFVLSEKWILGGGSINDAFEKSGEEARLNFASINYYQGKISISLTAGQRKRSTQENEEFWSHFSLKWVGKRGLWP